MWILICERPQRLRPLKLRMLRIKPIHNHHMPPAKLPHQWKVLLRTFKTINKLKIFISVTKMFPSITILHTCNMLV